MLDTTLKVNGQAQTSLPVISVKSYLKTTTGKILPIYPGVECAKADQYHQICGYGWFGCLFEPALWE